jgi:hypothetical protein
VIPIQWARPQSDISSSLVGKLATDRNSPED